MSTNLQRVQKSYVFGRKWAEITPRPHRRRPQSPPECPPPGKFRPDRGMAMIAHRGAEAVS